MAEKSLIEMDRDNWVDTAGEYQLRHSALLEAMAVEARKQPGTPVADLLWRLIDEHPV